jgi:hypothetical protein
MGIPLILLAPTCETTFTTMHTHEMADWRGVFMVTKAFPGLSLPRD